MTYVKCIPNNAVVATNITKNEENMDYKTEGLRRRRVVSQIKKVLEVRYQSPEEKCA